MQLSEPWRLHDVGDVEKFVRARLDRIDAYRALGHDDREDAVSAMFEVVLREEPTWNQSAKFSTFLHGVLGRRFTDYMRRNFFDTRYESQRGLIVEYTDDATVFDQPTWDDAEQLTERDLLDGIDLDSLSDDAQSTLFEIAIPMRRGVSAESLCLTYNLKPRTLKARLQALLVETGSELLASGDDLASNA